MADLKSVIIPPAVLKDLILKLWKRSKQLKKEEEMVLKSDPYLNEERQDDSEITDAAVGDVEKNIQDARLNLIQSARLEIRKALAKVKVGTYGMCEVCKKPIDIARLKAFPQATKCLECSKRTERK